MKTYMIKLVLSWLAGITADQWKSALTYVAAAAKKQLDGYGKASWVKTQLSAIFPTISGWASSLLVETAHAYAKKKGVIP